MLCFASFLPEFDRVHVLTDAGADEEDGGGGDDGAGFADACELNRPNPCRISLVPFPNSIDFFLR